MSDYIPLDECEHQGFYRIRCRNFDYGVFNERTKGFVGIREKFGSTYLFTEYHWDTGAPFGTVTPIELLERCPVKDLRESFILCDQHKMPIIHVEGDEPPLIAQRVHFDGTPLADDEKSFSYDNKVLYNWIESSIHRYENQIAK